MDSIGVIIVCQSHGVKLYNHRHTGKHSHGSGNIALGRLLYVCLCRLSQHDRLLCLLPYTRPYTIVLANPSVTPGTHNSENSRSQSLKEPQPGGIQETQVQGHQVTGREGEGRGSSCKGKARATQGRGREIIWGVGIFQLAARSRTAAVSLCPVVAQAHRATSQPL